MIVASIILNISTENENDLNIAGGYLPDRVASLLEFAGNYQLNAKPYRVLGRNNVYNLYLEVRHKPSAILRIISYLSFI